MEYVIEGKKFGLSYSDLREKYHEFISLNDEDFLKRLSEATHLACIICYLKEEPTGTCLSDIGIIHELIHLWHIPKQNTTSLKEIRELYKNALKLS